MLNSEVPSNLDVNCSREQEDTPFVPSHATRNGATRTAKFVLAGVAAVLLTAMVAAVGVKVGMEATQPGAVSDERSVSARRPGGYSQVPAQAPTYRQPGSWQPRSTPPVLPMYPAPTLPRRGRELLLSTFGAVGDGKKDNTNAFKACIAAARNAPGGAKIVVPPGRWLTGPFALASHITLHLQQNATILAHKKFIKYAKIPAFPSYFNSRDRSRDQYEAFISGTNLTDVVITGNGVIDGQGSKWWSVRARNTSLSAPRLVEFISCTDITVTNVTLQNSGFWTLHPIYCSRVHIHGITILAPENSRNTDGIDADSSTNVLIENCRIDAGDDSVAIKSGRDNFGIRHGRPSKNITMRSLTIGPGTHGISIGSELSGGVSDVYVHDIVFVGGDNGLRIKTTAGRGGYVRNVLFENVWLRNVEKAIIVTSGYASHASDMHPGNNYNINAVTTTSNITFSKITVTGCEKGAMFSGFPTAPFELRLKDVSIEPSRTAWTCAAVRATTTNVQPPPPASCLYA